MKKNNVNMLSGSITKGMLALTIPIMIMNVAQSLFNVVDMAVLRMFSDDRAVGAVGANGMLISLCTSLLIGLSAGANVVVARRVGAGDKERSDKAVMTSLLLSVTGGIILMIIGAVFARTFLQLINCPESLLDDATTYFRIYFYGIPVMMLYNFCASILRAIGDSKRPMNFLLLGCAIKLTLTFVFVGFFDMTVEGVAFATVISNIVACVLAFACLVRNNDVIRVDFKNIRFDFTELKDIMYIGVPAGFQSALYSLANVIITATVNSFGEAATTGISIANQFDSILYQISYAPSLATIPYISQNIGAGNLKRVKQTIVRGVLITTFFGATLGALSAIFSAQLSSIVSSSPEIIKYSQQKMIIVSSTYFICGINEVVGGVLKGMGKPIPPTVSSLIFLCLLRFIWVYFVFPYCPNLTFLYAVWPIGWTLSIIALLCVYFPAISKLQKRGVVQ